MRYLYFFLAGLLLTLSAAAQAHRPIQLHPQNGHYFLFRNKPAILITSAEHYGAVLNLDFDYIPYLDELQANGLNYTRIFTGSYVEMPGAFNIKKNTLAPAPNRFMAPWKRTAEAGYFNGGNKFDLTQWEEAYFARLKDFVSQAGKRDIIVEVTLFSSLYGDAGWQASPLHPENNVNKLPDLARNKVHTLDNGLLLPYQEALARKIAQELKAFDNVFYEIQNEPWADLGIVATRLETGIPNAQEWQKKVEIANPAALAWQKHLAAVIAKEEAALPYPHLIAQNIANFQYPIQQPDPAISIFNFHYALPAASTLNYGLNKVIGFDESGFAGSLDATYRQQAWQFILAGGGLFNNLDYSFSTEKENGTEKPEAPGGGSAALRAQLKILKNFMYGFNFIKMQPLDKDFVQGEGTVLGLAEPGKQYALYVAGSKTGKITLTLPKGKYAVQYLDPATGKAITALTRHRGGSITLAAPENLVSEFALGIRRAGSRAGNK